MGKLRTIAQDTVGLWGGDIALAGRLSGTRTQNSHV